ncbi:AMP-dependent synthetase/ligase [Sandaracinus amylolyticus]|uniref:AMP-dependent synthetase/ligase n=1 Tax=Sandaracinus amylolyticus TaxID=927083 RepID=UPI001F3485F9|nr:long-chain fatty acid--CoA ligase [Sandaracinus amylolyticus]
MRNLVECYQRSCERFADRPVLGTKGASTWIWTTYGELGSEIDSVRGGLASLGIGKGDVVAIISGNRVEWAVACYATYGLEATFVPMYEAQRVDEWKHILGDCEAKLVIASTREIFDRLLAMQPELPALQYVIGIDLPEDDPRSFATLAREGVASPVPARSPDPSVTAGLIYTSGTTGKPKGVILSHGNLASNVVAMSRVFPLEPTDRTLSFLPWAHSFGQVAELHLAVSIGASLALNDALPRLLENLSEVRPTLLVAVPRIFNRIYESVNEQIRRRPAPIRRLFDDGVRSAKRRTHGERLSLLERAELAIDDKLIFAKIRERFGGRLRCVISASAALSPEVAEFVDAIGLPVYEGYGLTETSPAVTVNTPAHRKIGSVGKPLPGVRVVIDESKGDVPGQGEVVVYGPNVMRGYHRRPEETASVLTADGGLRTGDLGRFDEDGYLFITGRIKEQFKLENGKYVMPAPLEEKIKLSPYVANVLIHGSNRPYVVAVVAPDVDAVRRWAQERGVALGDLTSDPRVRELMLREVDARSAGFAGFEVPKKVLVVGEDFTTDNDLLTPTLKLKRRNAEVRFARGLDQLYREPLTTPEPVVAP